MAKRPSDISFMAQGPSYQRALRLANARYMAERKELVDPNALDIQQMCSKIGDNVSFAKLSGADKSDLFSAILTIRRRLEIYDDLVNFEGEELGPLLSALSNLVAALPNYHGLLAKAVDEASEICGATVRDAWRMISEFANSAQSLLAIIEKISDEPRAYDKRSIRSRQQRHEAQMIRDCLAISGIEVVKSGPDEYGNKGNDGLELMARIVHYTSGKKPTPNQLRMRLTRIDKQS
jgi:hypothetical protein